MRHSHGDSRCGRTRQQALVLVGLCSLASSALGATAAVAWNYAQNTAANCNGSSLPCGPDHWKNLYSACDSSSTSAVYPQSPIELANVALNDAGFIPSFTSISGGCLTWTQVVSTDDFSVDFTQSAAKCTSNYITYEQQNWMLQSIAFRSPSEHTVGGGRYDGEAQLRHVSSTSGDIAIISVFLQVNAGATNASTNGNIFLSKLWSHLPSSSSGNTSSVKVTVSTGAGLSPYQDFLPGSQGQFQYTGSLTEPPCTTDVDWFIYETPVPISSTDLQRIRSLPKAISGSKVSQAGDNNRPVQQNVVAYTVSYVSGATASTTTTTVTRESSDAALVLAAISFTLLMILFFYIFKNNGRVEFHYEDDDQQQQQLLESVSAAPAGATAAKPAAIRVNNDDDDDVELARRANESLPHTPIGKGEM